jgi:hypothetical protein
MLGAQSAYAFIENNGRGKLNFSSCGKITAYPEITTAPPPSSERTWYGLGAFKVSSFIMTPILDFANTVLSC